MKKYKLIITSSEEVIGIFEDKSKSADKMMDVIKRNNFGLEKDNNDYLTPFDFTLEEIEVAGVNEDDYETALAMLDRKDDELQIIHNATYPHGMALRSLVKLITIAEAWNRLDGFVPDFSDSEQHKYYPLFDYDTTTESFVYASAFLTDTHTCANVGSRLCFKSYERAEQFGKQFIDLWNDFLLFRDSPNMEIKEINELLGANYSSKEEFLNRVNWGCISSGQVLSEEFIREFQEMLGWRLISYYQKLSEPFIREFKDRVDWEGISGRQVLSEDFIREFKDRVDWCGISFRQKLSEDFIREFQDKVNWICIFNNQELSEEFREEFKCKLNNNK